MGDLYSELLVKRRSTAKDVLIKVGLGALTALAVLAGFILPFVWLVAIGLGVACYFIFPRTDLEYEYLFVNGELDVDVIMGKAKRKSLKSFQLKEVEMIAPLNSHRVDYYKGNTAMRTLDYSSGIEDHKRYLMIAADGDNGACKVILEPDQEMLDCMKKSAPSKVFFD